MPLATKGTRCLSGSWGETDKAGSGNCYHLKLISDAINVQVLIKLTPSGVGVFSLVSLGKKKKSQYMGFYTFKRNVCFLILLWYRHFQHLALG